MKLDRLLAITMLMLGRRRIGAKELADRFEVSLRTVYRDMETLCQAGIPIVSYAGEGGGYEIMERYRLERQFLTLEELQAMVIALKGIQPTLEEREIGRLLDKVGAMLSGTEHDRLADASEQMVIDINPWGGGTQDKAKVALLREAVRDRFIVRFVYTDMAGERSERRCEPVRLVLKGLVWYVYGYCLIREDFRLFRLSRVRELTRTDETFERREEPESRPLTWSNMSNGACAGVKDIVIRFAPVARTRAEDYFGSLDGTHGMEDLPDGSLLVRSAQPDEPWLHLWLLGFGTSAYVVSPPELAAAVRECAAEVLRLYPAADTQLSAAR
ncbi:YafY family transcriptional regulator [Cohnella ginsengisoli]|uniref:YafY family transcriptional regulator n=1 Tax=Cohnella ginsengisoli TaxID=425004 RepID=A0A9X4KN35_9BACL|nr:YafY family protein [Cohnella ginsengisoli]MDG0794454.1 YafY family transcriptional regulator [Cohnella ginsengisoli]